MGHTPFSDLLSHTRPKKLPGFIDLLALPTLRDADGVALDPTLGLALIRTLAARADGFDALDATRPLLESESVDNFLSGLFEDWRKASFNGRYAWVLEGMARLGGDRCALAIETELGVWPTASESARKRSLVALETLRRIGTDTALLVLLGMGQQETLPTIRMRATEQLRLAARARKTTVGELGDRITPSCGLDEDGRRVLDFGGRRFETVFDAYFVPRVRDEAGRVLPTLPAPTSDDDPDAARLAHEAWTVLSRQLESIARVQSARLEDAMITERRWKLAEWNRYLRSHPLMVHFTRRLVWGIFNPKGELRSTFRTTEDGTCVDLHDEDVELPSRGRVGLIHPLDLEESVRATWAEHMMDYEIVPPFEQLGRALARPTAAESKAKSLTRFEGRRIDAKVAHDTLIELGFTRDDHYIRMFFERRYEDGALLVRIHLDPGIQAGSSDQAPEQTIPKVVFRHGSASVRLGKVSPVAFSEAVRAIEHVAGSARR